jgi:hypothetical protein
LQAALYFAASRGSAAQPPRVLSSDPDVKSASRISTMPKNSLCEAMPETRARKRAEVAEDANGKPVSGENFRR